MNYDKRKWKGSKLGIGQNGYLRAKTVIRYFCNLENRNFVSKSMNCLVMNNGKITKDHNQTLNEAKLFYKILFEKKITTNVDLKESLNYVNFPILIEEMKSKLEGPLKDTEILFCLTKATNNT